MEGGVFAVIEDGDTITVDIPNRTITLNVDDEDAGEAPGRVEASSAEGQERLSGQVLQQRVLRRHRAVTTTYCEGAF